MLGSKTYHNFLVGKQAQEEFIAEYVEQSTDAVKAEISGKDGFGTCALAPGPPFVEVVTGKNSCAESKRFRKPGRPKLRTQVINTQIYPETNKSNNTEFGDLNVSIP